MNKKRFPNILKGLAVCAGYAAAFLGLLAVKAALIILLCIGLLAGAMRACLTEHASPHRRGEVTAYLRTMCPGEEIAVSRHHETLPDEDHSLADMRVWDCWFEDLPEVVFHVTSSWSGGGNFPSKAGYDLSTDLKRVLWDYYLGEYESGGGSLSCWVPERDRLTLTYSTMAEAETAADQLQDFHDWWGRQSHGEIEPLSVVTQFDGGPLPVPAGLQDTIYVDRITPETTFNYDSTREFLLGTSRYIILYYYGYYNLPCPEFTDEKREEFARETWLWYADYTYRDSPNGAVSIWDKQHWIPLEDWAGPDGPLRGVGTWLCEISYGGLYEILSRLDCGPEGSPEHFTITGQDGAVYEFSYDFFTTADDGDQEWYYLKDGEVCSIERDTPVLDLNSAPVRLTTGLIFQHY